MWRKTIAAIVGLMLGALAGGVLGLVGGAVIGGNFMTGFRFNGVQGYEATGQIGAMAGALLGAVLGMKLALRFADRKKKE